MGKNKEPVPVEDEEEEYVVEKIVKKRIIKGKTEYFIKWENYTEDDNTWEPEGNLECPDKIEEFEAKLKKDKEKAENAGVQPEGGNISLYNKKRKTEDGDSSKKSKNKKTEEEARPKGFDRGLDPERIIGATDSSGELMFLMKWKGTDEADLVPSKQANVKCPHIVIGFYEERLTWHTSNDDDKED